MKRYIIFWWMFEPPFCCQKPKSFSSTYTWFFPVCWLGGHWCPQQLLCYIRSNYRLWKAISEWSRGLWWCGGYRSASEWCRRVTLVLMRNMVARVSVTHPSSPPTVDKHTLVWRQEEGACNVLLHLLIDDLMMTSVETCNYHCLVWHCAFSKTSTRGGVNQSR